MTSPARVLKSIGPKLVPFFKSVAVYLVLLPEGPSLLAAGVKCAPALSLILFVLLHGVAHDNEYAFSRRILVGLCWSCVGDALLVWPQHFMLGMAAFGVAQCAYASAFTFRPLRPALGLAIYALTAFVVNLLVPNAPGVLKLGVPVYSLLLATMAWRATARFRYSWTWSELCSSVGGVCFVVSDGLIGFHEFYAPVQHAQVLIMSSYYLAQLCIALSVVDSTPERKCIQLQRHRTTDKLQTADNAPIVAHKMADKTKLNTA